jgi:hypothetical protein
LCASDGRLQLLLQHLHQLIELVRVLSVAADGLDQLTLAVEIDATAVAAKGREHVLVTEILTPRFELLRRPAHPLAEPDQRVPETVD